MINYIKKHPIYFLLVGSGILIFALGESGMCFSQARWLSDDDKIKTVLEYQMNRRRMPIETIDRGTQYFEQIPYKDAEEYLKHHPDCCAVNPGGGYDVPSIESGGVVVTKYITRYHNEQGKLQKKERIFNNTISSCGKVIW